MISPLKDISESKVMKVPFIQRAFRKGSALFALIRSRHVAAFAAQAGYFFILSFIPLLFLIVTIVSTIGYGENTIISEILRLFPEQARTLIRTIIHDVYLHSGGTIPLTAVAALWSAGKGVLAINYGLNEAYERVENRNYFLLRIRASLITLILVFSIIAVFTLPIFGNKIADIIAREWPLLHQAISPIIRFRYLASFIFLFLIWTFIYRFLPNRDPDRRNRLYYHIPGALLASIGWLIISFIFSIYLKIFTGFNHLYGSMTTLILSLLWLYFCMYTMLLGGILNNFLRIRRRMRSENSSTI